MKISVIRTMEPKQYLYKIEGYNSVFGKTNHNFNMLPLSIKVCKDVNCFEMRQRGGILRIIASIIPLLYSDSLFSYDIYLNENCVGYSETNEYGGAFYFHIEDDVLELRAHNNSTYSVLENGKQVAVITKQSYSSFEHNKYTIWFETDKESRMEVLLMLCMFIDNRFHKDGNNSWHSNKWKKTFVLDDEYEERAKWRPES